MNQENQVRVVHVEWIDASYCVGWQDKPVEDNPGIIISVAQVVEETDTSVIIATCQSENQWCGVSVIPKFAILDMWDIVYDVGKGPRRVR